MVKRERAAILVLGLAAAAACASWALAQPADHRGMHKGGPGLFLARVGGSEVVPRQGTRATATAAVIVDRTKNMLSYDITFNGLERGPATRIGLYNFGAGGNGPTVAILCGASGASACPNGASARVAGSVSARLTNSLLSEFTSSRIYVQIDSGDGRPEIRGQLFTNGAMVPVRNYVARLGPSSPGATGEGTAVLFETYLPRDRVAVEYSVTVAGTSGTPDGVGLVGVPHANDGRAARFVKSAGLPNLRRLLSTAARRGGSFNGRYVARRGDRLALFPDKFVQSGQNPAVTVKTSRFPRGELAGVFVPIG